MADRRSAFIYRDEMSRHVLREDHVFKPVRLRYTYELLEEYGAFQVENGRLVDPRYATDEEVQTFHTPDYATAVKSFGEGRMLVDPGRYNFSQYGDNPTYPGMYDAATLVVGGSLMAADMILDGEVDAAFNPGGGLHHAAAGFTSGFCVFNDAVVAIKRMVERGMKVAYVDIDVHHGDGVQNAFYDTDSVLTVSVHESGRFIFPGTGHPNETGTGSGTGYAVNLPLAPYTDDEIYHEAFAEIVPPLVQAFGPDVIVTQLGIDTYHSDILGHLLISTQGFTRAVEMLSGMADRWLALGGGGYDVEAVARCWALAYGVMLEREWPEETPESTRLRSGVGTLRDASGPRLEEGDRAKIREFARRSVEEVKKEVFGYHRV